MFKIYIFEKFVSSKISTVRFGSKIEAKISLILFCTAVKFVVNSKSCSFSNPAVFRRRGVFWQSFLHNEIPMTLNSPYTALAFDVLHTLVDDSGFPLNVLWRFIEESGEHVDLEAYFREYDALGRELFDWPSIHPFVPIRELHRRRIRRLYARYGVFRHVEKDLERLWEHMANSKLYPDAETVLPKLEQNFRLAILSNADRDDPLIRKLLGLGYSFEVIVTSEEAGCYKPAPAIFETLLKKLNLPPEKVLLVGDSPKADLVGAHRAGMPVAWINRKAEKLPPGTPPPTYEFPSLHELWAFLQTGQPVV